MKISENWLCDYVEHGLTSDELADRLTMCGLEVESVEHFGPQLDGVVVGLVVETSRHPDADRLTLCQVDLGEAEAVQIVCGAENVAAGQKVPVATVGTTLSLPDRKDPAKRTPVTIKKAKLRGQLSQGMICAEDELGFSDKHDGIMVLPSDAPAGQSVAEYLSARGEALGDTVLDIAITPNRPDAVSHLGVARDVAALTGQRLTRHEASVRPDSDAKPPVTVRIEDPDGCRRYVALVVRDLKVGPSPAWMQRRLEAVGLRSRNNIVDITNFVMLELGQPLHAFDLDMVAEQRIVVASTLKETTFTTLDDKERRLPAGTLMIRDGKRDVAIAGVMGGQNSEVSEGTTNVLIESAYFDPVRIRRTAKLLGLQTDASYRFERGVDPSGQMRAARRAAELMVELGEGRFEPGGVDAHPQPVAPTTLTLRLGQVKRHLGVSIEAGRVTDILGALGFGVERVNDGLLRCDVPMFRPDVTREIDVIEEIARIYGYENIPEPDASRVPHFVPVDRTEPLVRDRVLRLITGQGYREIYTNSLISQATADALVPGRVLGPALDGLAVTTANAINQEMSALRPSVLAGMLPVVAHNANHGAETIRLAEFGHVFARNEHPDNVIPAYAERETLGLVAVGARRRRSWDEDRGAIDFFDLKGTVEGILEAVGAAVEMKPLENDGRFAFGLVLSIDGTPVGALGRLAAATTALFDLDQDVYAAEINWEAITIAAKDVLPQYRAIDRFPVVQRDLALVVAADQPVGPMTEAIRSAGTPLLRSIEVFDLYQGEGVADGQKSIALSVSLGADRTLTEEDIVGQMDVIVEALRSGFGAELRQ